MKLPKHWDIHLSGIILMILGSFAVFSVLFTLEHFVSWLFR